MPTAHVRLKPIEWFQEIRHYPQQGGEDRYLGATCTYSDDSNVRLSTGAKLSEFLADLSIMDEEPQYADGKPLEHGIGLLFYHDRPEIAAHTIGWFPLRGKNYDAVWDQVRHGAYAGCDIDMWLVRFCPSRPILFGMSIVPYSSRQHRFGSHAHHRHKSRQPNHVVEGDYSAAARHSLRSEPIWLKSKNPACAAVKR